MDRNCGAVSTGCRAKDVEVFSIGAAKKRTAMGQDSEPPAETEMKSPRSGVFFDFSQCFLRPGRCSGDSDVVDSNDWQYATQTAAFAFRQTNAKTNAAMNLILIERPPIIESISKQYTRPM